MNRATALCLLLIAVFATGGAYSQDAWTYLDNGRVRLGVNLGAGGCIGWFSRSGSSDNLLNAYDVGRYVQQSYYGDKDGSDWNGTEWRYNPVQGGSWKNEPAVVLETKAEKESLYVKSTPRHWATGERLDEVVLEEWLRLEGMLARVKFKMTFNGTRAHEPRHQELPALFVKPELDTLVFVNAAGVLSRKQPGFPNEIIGLGEPWAAWVDAGDRGLGVWCPHSKEATCYRVRNGNKGDCSYIAPLQTFALRPGLLFEYEAALTLGNLQEMREIFEKLKAQP